jgi:CRP-like cAMP-binding protein
MATSEVVETPLKQFLEMLRRDKELVQRFVFTLCERLTEADRRVKVLASRDADARLGTLLIQLAGTRGRQSANGGGCVLRVTHTDLAQMAAMSRSHVTVTMGNFRNKHLVEYTRDKPITVNVPALKQYLDSRYPQS